MSLERILGQYVTVLDEGFVSLQGVFGGDADIEQFARVSYQKGTRKTTDTRGLIRYLVAHDHGSPIEAVDFKFHVRLPISVMRQLIRHRLASVNEASARYSEVVDRFYVPTMDQMGGQSKSNKQGRDSLIEYPASARELMLNSMAHDFSDYQKLLDLGLARETARGVLPVNSYTEMYWKINARSLMNFLNLRCDSHAQWEIRQYANVFARMFELACPITYEAWYDYQFGAVTFSRMEMDVLSEAYGGVSPNKSDEYYRTRMDALGMTKREIEAFYGKLCKTDRETIPELDLNLFRTPEEQASLDTDG
jgi:thymidylate synthase (FAD)